MHFIDVQNVRHKFEAQKSRNPFKSAVYREKYDESVPYQFLRQFLAWLEATKEGREHNFPEYSSLMNQTLQAAIFTTRSTICAIEWVFENIEDVDYVLLGKWTQDAEEHHFGKLRHASTYNFRASPLQFIEANLKLRARRFLK